VKVSFEVPEYTAQVDGLGTLRLLDAIKETGVRTRFYQASTSELYGKIQEMPQRETTPFYPAQPLRGRQALRLLDGGELPRGLRALRDQRHPVQPREPAARPHLRDAQDQPRGAARIAQGLQTALYLGNLDAKRDWGYAPEYVRPCG
jgi:GDPmannose 4,6-dehydratase